MKNTFTLNTFLKKYYQENDPIIVACSGGPDSMFLLYKLLDSSYKHNIVVCYFNHKTRPETEEEEKFLVQLGKERGFQVEVAECDFQKIKQLYPSKSFEELAREKRYQFFDAIMNIYHSKYVLTAHHLDDRIETYMFNMLRGTKLTGLINMKESHGGILRPLLKLEKSEILQYLDNRGLQYCIDSTNTDTAITRNKMRHEILPKFSEIHPHHKKNISKLLEYFEELKAHLDEQVELFFIENNSFPGKNKQDTLYGNSFSLALFHSCSPLLQKEIITHIFHLSNGNSTIGLSEGNIAEVIRFIGGPNNKTMKDIKNMHLKKDGSSLYF